MGALVFIYALLPLPGLVFPDLLRGKTAFFAFALWQMLPAFFAFGCLIRTVRDQHVLPTAQRVGRWILVAASACVCLGDALFFGAQNGLFLQDAREALQFWTRGPYLAGDALLFLSLLALLMTERLEERARAALDALLLTACTGLILAHFAFLPLLRNAQGVRPILAIYAIVSLAMLCLSLFLLSSSRSEPVVLRARAVLCLALMLICLSNCVLLMAPAYDSFRWTCVGQYVWGIAILTLGMSALQARSSTIRVGTASLFRAVQILPALLPYSYIAVAVGLVAVGTGLTDGGTDSSAIWAGTGVLVLLALRQFVVTMQNVRRGNQLVQINEHLDEMVALRTRQLHEQTEFVSKLNAATHIKDVEQVITEFAPRLLFPHVYALWFADDSQSDDSGANQLTKGGRIVGQRSETAQGASAITESAGTFAGDRSANAIAEIASAITERASATDENENAMDENGDPANGSGDMANRNGNSPDESDDVPDENDGAVLAFGQGDNRGSTRLVSTNVFANSADSVRLAQVDPRERSDKSQWLCLRPLQYGDYKFGYIGALWQEKHDATDIVQLDFLAREAALALHNAQLLEDALIDAERDSVTGLFNHRGVQNRMERAFEYAQDEGQPLAVAFMDLDRFKLFNDTYSPAVGDLVLKHVAGFLSGQLELPDGTIVGNNGNLSNGNLCNGAAYNGGGENSDYHPTSPIAGRVGGDEFWMVLPGLDRVSAIARVDELNANLQQAGFALPGKEVTVPIAVSFGLAVFPDDATGLQRLISIAEAQLRGAKNSGLAVRSSSSIERLREELRDHDSFGALDAIVAAIDAKDAYTRAHSEEVTEYAIQLAAHLGLSDETFKILRTGAILHDVGKIAVPTEVLAKPGLLTPEEFNQMKTHPWIGAILVSALPGLGNIVDIVRSHHERYDGSGYPDHLRGDAIPMLARLTAVADAFSAMTCNRPYRRALDEAEALRRIEEGAGTQFDPAMARAWVQLRREMLENAARAEAEVTTEV